MAKGRPKGIKNAIGTKKVGAKEGVRAYRTTRLTDKEILEVKRAIITLIEAEEADNLTEACKILNFSPLRAYNWFVADKEWANQVRQAQEIVADRLEADLDAMNNPVARIFRLKKLRPEYRDTYKFDVTSESLEKLLKELRDLGNKS